MMRSYLSALTTLSLLVLGGCSGNDDDNAAASSATDGGDTTAPGTDAADEDDDDDDATGTSDDSGQPSGRLLWTITASTPWLMAVDTGSHKETLNVKVAEGMTNVCSLEVGEATAWVGRDDGFVVAVDLDKGEIASAIDLNPLFEDAFELRVDALALGDGCVYAVTDVSPHPSIVRIDTKTFEATQAAEPLQDITLVHSMVYDGTDLWLAGYHKLALLQIDPVTLETKSVTRVGQDPDAPGTLGDFYGYGFLVDVKDTVWMVDADSDSLIRIDKASLAASIVDDLSDLGLGNSHDWLTNGKDLFLCLDETNKVVRFDGATGERLKTYDLADQGGAGTMAVDEDRIYVKTDDSSDQQVVELDIESGKTLQTFMLPVWTDRIAVQ